MDYKDINRESWNKKVDYHLESDFYRQQAFMDGETSLKSIELDLLGDVQGQSILHLQCHFGQDTLSLARMGAQTTGVDISDKAIQVARQLNDELDLDSTFILSDVYELPNVLNQQYDMVFTTYGVIGWLPDMNRWAQVISQYLKPGGKLIFVEFHPVVWMFDDDFKNIAYDYFNKREIREVYSGTYADTDAPIESEYVMWNHSLSEVMSSLMNAGLSIMDFKEYNYSPYPCFDHIEEYGHDQYRIKHLDNKIPMVYSLVCEKI